MSNNKVHFGVKNAYVFPITETVDPDTGVVSTTYGDAVKWPGAVSIDLQAQGSQENFYADDSIYYVVSNTNFYQGDFESASIPDAIKEVLYGDIIDDNDAVVEIQEATTKYFAFAFETSGDVGGHRTVFYKCSATRPNAGGSTKTDSSAPQTQTVTITAIGRADEVNINAKMVHLIQASLNEGDTGYSSFFTTPYTPTVTSH